MKQKLKQRFRKYLWLLDIPKKVEIGSFARARVRSQTSGADQKGPDPQHCSNQFYTSRIPHEKRGGGQNNPAGLCSKFSNKIKFFTFSQIL
jgi:hypothetical protein